jgi:hypothetical protein
MERPSRRNASKAAKAEAATAGLKNLKEKGLKRFDTVAEAEDNSVYDTVRARGVLPRPRPLPRRGSVSHQRERAEPTPPNYFLR